MSSSGSHMQPRTTNDYIARQGGSVEGMRWLAESLSTVSQSSRLSHYLLLHKNKITSQAPGRGRRDHQVQASTIYGTDGELLGVSSKVQLHVARMSRAHFDDVTTVCGPLRGDVQHVPSRHAIADTTPHKFPVSLGDRQKTQLPTRFLFRGLK